MFQRILVANRGEIALRIFRTCKEMGINTVAVYSDVDRLAPHVRAADIAVCLGGDDPAESYLDAEKIIHAGLESGAEAIHPGYGFLSENADFADKCTRAGLHFIGPPAEVLRKVGDKVQARRLATDAGVPAIPGTLALSESTEELMRDAVPVGFPVMVKAVSGGGGKGIRRVERAEDLPEALERASSEARAAFGDGSLYLEKFIEDPRHVEVQILADHLGNVVHLFERECSIQRRHQKIVEEAPSPLVDDRLRAALGDAAARVARAAGYRGAGTVEFLVDQNGSFYFMEVNARLQVEHPVTEAITGFDLVEQQIEIAAGRPLGFGQEEVIKRGHAIECRIYAEDPEADFLPCPGKILKLQPPSGPGVRFDCGVESGDLVPLQYDSILAKLIVWGSNRSKAIARMARALRETSILGVKTPVELLLDLVESEPFRQGWTSTGFLRRTFPDWHPSPRRVQAVLLGWLVMAESTGGEGTVPAPTRLPEDGTAMSWDPWRLLGRFRLGE